MCSLAIVMVHLGLLSHVELMGSLAAFSGVMTAFCICTCNRVEKLGGVFVG
jgi:hypothetical protein